MTETLSHTALITGASRGLGRALARELARQGWNLLLDARHPAPLEAVRAELQTLTHVQTRSGDVGDAFHRQELLEAAQTLGGIDVLINNASMLGPSPQPDLLSFPLDILEQVYRTNVIAPLALIQTLEPQLKSNACIINITSDAGQEVYAGWGGYGSSKAALEHLSAILAVERSDLSVYWVDPGDMRTDMHQAAFPGEDISDRLLPEESVPGILQLIAQRYPSGRYLARALPARNQ
ncbi:SDR family NAD(P)-dependent oxidoreductase [Dictyobacter formicarum]|uniref:NADP-dependent 3-hydroxy acid dehydrogenase YdfG n=1 Tax=Dictyobacter formicarum TaxID=2778368 RepID=A0ABQ3V9Y1_9CHLR|nr:SDR family oxidoreductase [Dictyobacter formicarum]GHO82799.1 short-chain dehydrogenase [Dictyobacter formicarum]